MPDPYFGGVGPERTGCLECGSCMTGCRYGAKNTLVKNYLGLAENAGRRVLPMTTVTGFEQLPDGTVARRHRRTGRWLRRQKCSFTAAHLVFAAGTWGTQRLLQDARQGHAPEAVRPARRADADQLRVDPRCRAVRHTGR